MMKDTLTPFEKQIKSQYVEKSFTGTIVDMAVAIMQDIHRDKPHLSKRLQIEIAYRTMTKLEIITNMTLQDFKHGVDYHLHVA